MGRPLHFPAGASATLETHALNTVNSEFLRNPPQYPSQFDGLGQAQIVGGTAKLAFGQRQISRIKSDDDSRRGSTLYGIDEDHFVGASPRLHEPQSLPRVFVCVYFELAQPSNNNQTHSVVGSIFVSTAQDQHALFPLQVNL